jgi:predicted transposase/invertase (TIGR01784 family)
VIDPVLKNSQSDLLVKTRIGGKDCFVYTLFEHKSYYDKFALFQLLKYMVKIWEVEIKNKAKYLTPIIPILFYHGGKSWDVGDNFKAYFHKPDERVIGYIPDFIYSIYNLTDLPEECMAGNLWFIAGLRIMKYIHSLKPELENIYDLILQSVDISEKYPEELITISVYVLSASNEEEHDYIIDVFSKKHMEDMYMSIADKLKEEGRKEGLKKGREEGREEGLKKGMEKGMEKGQKQKATETARTMKSDGIDIKVIAKYTGLTKEEIEEL